MSRPSAPNFSPERGRSAAPPLLEGWHVWGSWLPSGRLGPTLTPSEAPSPPALPAPRVAPGSRCLPVATAWFPQHLPGFVPLAGALSVLHRPCLSRAWPCRPHRGDRGAVRLGCKRLLPRTWGLSPRQGLGGPASSSSQVFSASGKWALASPRREAWGAALGPSLVLGPAGSGGPHASRESPTALPAYGLGLPSFSRRAPWGLEACRGV